ncbi:MAG: ribonuclease III family protein [Clostridiales bacterium]|nr:ribonuclease III family protein [Clostridiales bacterium]
MTSNDLKYIERQIGYEFENRMLLQQAFIRKSYSQEHPDSENNEVLEFVGDRALDIAVMKTLLQYYCGFTKEDEFYSSRSEGKLTELKRKLVEGKMLSSRMDILGFQDYLIMGKGDVKKNVQNDAHVKEDLFEAIIGAVTIDCGWDIDTIQEVVGLMLDPHYYLENGFDESNNYVALVQQWYQLEYEEAPVYEFVEYNGEFNCIAHLYNYKFTGSGLTKNEARMEVAKQLYHYLEDNDLLYTMADEIDEPSFDLAINQLQELAQKGYFSMPDYSFEEQRDMYGNTFWICICSIDEYDVYVRETASLKKEAKKAAAYSMLLHVLEQAEK